MTRRKNRIELISSDFVSKHAKKWSRQLKDWKKQWQEGDLSGPEVIVLSVVMYLNELYPHDWISARQVTQVKNSKRTRLQRVFF